MLKFEVKNVEGLNYLFDEEREKLHDKVFTILKDFERDPTDEDQIFSNEQSL
jgi:hypothetical protein